MVPCYTMGNSRIRFFWRFLLYGFGNSVNHICPPIRLVKTASVL